MCSELRPTCECLNADAQSCKNTDVFTSSERIAMRDSKVTSSPHFPSHRPWWNNLVWLSCRLSRWLSGYHFHRLSKHLKIHYHYVEHIEHTYIVITDKAKILGLSAYVISPQYNHEQNIVDHR